MRRWSPLLALALLAAAPAASACEAGICVEKVFPTEGQVVPVDAQMWVYFDNVNGFDIGAVLRDADGEVVPTTATVLDQGPLETLMRQLLHVVPDAPLEPYASYRLDLVIEEDLCVGSSPDQVRFETIGLTDPNPPALEGDVDVSARFIEDYATGSNCSLGPPRHRYVVEVTPADDAVAYRLYQQGIMLAVAPAGERVDGGGVGRLVDAVELDRAGEGAPPNECFVVRAVDLSGNEDPNEVAHCLEGEAPSGDDDGGTVQACFCDATPQSGVSAVVVAGGLGLWGRLRRWRRALR